jgi:hypothetical protein
MQRTLQVELFNIMRNVRDATSIANLRGPAAKRNPDGASPDRL